jgi:hypothetical protein
MSLYKPYVIQTGLLYQPKFSVSVKAATRLHHLPRITVGGALPAAPCMTWRRAQGQIIPILK